MFVDERMACDSARAGSSHEQDSDIYDEDGS